jgi:carbamoyl-phosphate synthase large subunit
MSPETVPMPDGLPAGLGELVGRPPLIVVTGVGGAPGFDLARTLMRLGCRVIGTDTNPLAPGLALPGLTPRTTPPGDDPTFRDALLGLCRDLRPDALISTVERELPHLIALQYELGGLGVRTWLPDLAAAEACADKAQFHTVLTQHGIPTPRTWLPHQLDQISAGLPLVVKPRFGQGAQNVLFCSTIDQARVLCELVPEPIVQERLTGREFTADCLIDRTARASVILRYRLLVKAGLAMVAATFHNHPAAELVKQTAAAVGATGLCCAQGFLTDDGQITMTEINARIAGAFPLSQAAGARLVEQTLNGLFGLQVDHDQLGYKPGIYLTKYIETLATGESDLP